MGNESEMFRTNKELVAKLEMYIHSLNEQEVGFELVVNYYDSGVMCAEIISKIRSTVSFEAVKRLGYRWHVCAFVRGKEILAYVRYRLESEVPTTYHIVTDDDDEENET